MRSAVAFVRRWAVRFLQAFALLAVVLVLALVFLLTVDLGPTAREYAERYGSRYLERPLHIGRVGIRLATGEIVVEDLRIEGLTPEARPFLTARRIEVTLPWWTLIRRQQLLIESVEMIDWNMVVELFPDGRHTFPRLRPQQPGGPRRFTTRAQFVHASRGEFTYVQHGTWTTVSRNLDVVVGWADGYRGRASFSDGTVTIKNYEPMRSDMHCTFTIDGGKVLLDRIDLLTDGAASVIDGEVDFGHWPNQVYRVKSHLEAPRMREIFFARDRFTLEGEADFDGVFRLFKGGYELKGRFASPVIHLAGFAFPALTGALTWTPTRFDVYDAGSGFHGGQSRFTFGIAPLGSRRPSWARLDASYEDVDLAAFTDFLDTRGLRLAGRASGQNLLEWPLGRWSDHQGHGQVTVAPPPGVTLFSRSAPPVLSARTDAEEAARPVPEPLSPGTHVPVGGQIAYRFGPEWIDVEPSWASTETTYVEFEGRTAYGERARLPFYTRSADWQESDRLLAAILTAFGSPTGAVAMGGHGEFRGVMLNSFRQPRIEGSFRGEQTRAWGVVWGQAEGQVVVEDGYVDVRKAVVRKDGSEIRVDGRFSLSYPRRDARDEIDARIWITTRPLADLRHAFDMDAYPLDGSVTGEYHIFGRYNRPVGFGRTTVESGEAYGEPFDEASAALRFEGVGVRFDGVEITKGGGRITGAAYVDWDGRYSFNADGRRIPMESLALERYPQAPLYGLLDFKGGGTGFFQDPRYEARVQVRDLFISDEGVGEVSGWLGVRDETLSLEFEAASPRLAISGTGRIGISPGADADMSFRFTETSLDPYVRTFQSRLSPFTSAIASGTLRFVGPLAEPERLRVEASVEKLDLRLFDYSLANQGPISLALDHQVIELKEVRLVGEDTRLDVSGTIDLAEERIAAKADGDANLGILQGFFRNLRSSGQASVAGEIRGSVGRPVFSGTATITDGRIRYFSLPHAIEAINGRVAFDSRGIRLTDPVTGRPGIVAALGGGQVRFGGLIGLEGYVPADLGVTAAGENMHLRFPEGFRSVVDADLALVGTLSAPTLNGSVTVRSAVYDRRLNIGSGLFELVGAGNAASGVGSGAPTETTLPLRFDVRIVAPSALRIENNVAQIVSSADLSLRGSYDRPLLFGRAEVERGRVFFEGKQYVVTYGTIDFINPTRIEPSFDVRAETRVRAQGQTYEIDLRFVGTVNRLDPQLTSDPPLPPVDILSLLFSDVPQVQDPEMRALQQPGSAERELLQSRVTQMLASSLSSPVDQFVEQAIGLDTFQITPSFIDPYQRLAPGARLTIGKRISDRVYLTFSRSLTSPTDQIIWMLEYDESDRLSWIVSKNEDRTYAVDIRVRHRF